LNIKIPNVDAVARLAVLEAAMQVQTVSVNLSDIRFESFVSNLIFIGIRNVVLSERDLVEGKETNVTYLAWTATFNN
jgi:CRISPR/Cas system CMR-associated protein Cmr3 (group 5 of RAMP superfamily)